MKQVPIQRLRIDETGRLLVTPCQPNAMYPHIYREGNGLRWDVMENSFVAWEPARWAHSELLRHIIATVLDSLSEHLVLTQQTVWDNVSPTTEKELREVLGGAAV